MPLSLVPAPLAAGSRNGPERKEWTTAEDEIIQNGVAMFGCKWRRIAAQLPGRSDDAVRNRWSRLHEAMHRSLQAKRVTEEPAPTQHGAAGPGGGGGAGGGGGGGGGGYTAGDGAAGRQPGPGAASKQEQKSTAHSTEQKER